MAGDGADTGAEAAHGAANGAVDGGFDGEFVDGVTDLLPAACRLCASRLGVHYPSGWICAICEWRVGDLPDGELAPPRIDVVYYLRLDDRLKIGTTARPRQRFSQIAHDEVMAFERGDRRLEQRRHHEFAASRLGSSEWFAFDEPVRTHVRMLGAGAIDPWDLHARWVSEGFALRG